MLHFSIIQEDAAANSLNRMQLRLLRRGLIMRKTLVSLAVLAAMPIAVASAADMPMKAVAPVPYAAAYNWTGLYVGGEFGWGLAIEPLGATTML